MVLFTLKFMGKDFQWLGRLIIGLTRSLGFSSQERWTIAHVKGIGQKTNQSPQSNSSPSILIGQYNYWANMEACGKLLRFCIRMPYWCLQHFSSSRYHVSRQTIVNLWVGNSAALVTLLTDSLFFMFLIQATLILTSVRTCSLGVCYDKRWDCKDLANDGHCQSNPHATLRECPISCGVHCSKYIYNIRAWWPSIHSCCVPNKTNSVGCIFSVSDTGILGILF